VAAERGGRPLRRIKSLSSIARLTNTSKQLDSTSPRLFGDERMEREIPNIKQHPEDGGEDTTRIEADGVHTVAAHEKHYTDAARYLKTDYYHSHT
jgi:hypothetical protein